MSACATLACLIALAPVDAPTVAPAAPATGGQPLVVPRVLRVAAAARLEAAAEWRLVQAAGSVLVLRDNRVAYAVIAPAAPPADGFAYER